MDASVRRGNQKGGGGGISSPSSPIITSRRGFQNTIDIHVISPQEGEGDILLFAMGPVSDGISMPQPAVETDERSTLASKQTDIQ